MKRVNFQVGIWKLPHIPKPDIPDPVQGHGWTIDENGMMVLKWTDADIMPVELVDILEKTGNDGRMMRVEMNSMQRACPLYSMCFVTMYAVNRILEV